MSTYVFRRVAIGAAALCVSAGTAAAGTISYNFTGSDLVNVVGPGQSFGFTGSDGVSSVSVLGQRKSGSSWVNTSTVQTLLGLGVVSGILENPELDGFGRDERLRLDFAENVMVRSLVFTLADASDDAQITIESANFTQSFELGDGVGLPRVFVLDLAGLPAGNPVYVAALGDNDNFFLAGITVETNSPVALVPLPTAGATGLAGLAMLGAVRRRRA